MDKHRERRIRRIVLSQKVIIDGFKAMLEDIAYKLMFIELLTTKDAFKGIFGIFIMLSTILLC